MANTLSKEAKAKQQRCLDALEGLINKGLLVVSTRENGDYKELHIQCVSDEGRKALYDIERQIRGIEGIWFDTATYMNGTREWSLDWSMEPQGV